MRSRGMRTTVATVAGLLAVPLVLTALGKPRRGVFLGIPYSFERPTSKRVRQSLWDPRNRHILTPHIYGWGYSVNLHAVARRLGLLAA